MKKCIYLKDTKPILSFKSEEHIIPAAIGGKTVLNKGIVSDQANNMFSKLELEFCRNSPILLSRQFFGPGKRGSLSEKKATKSNVYVMVNSHNPNDSCLGYVKKGKPYKIPQMQVLNKREINFGFDVHDGDLKKQYIKFLNRLKKFKGKYKFIQNKNILEDQIILGFFKNKWYVASSSRDNLNIINDLLPKIIKKEFTCLDRKPKSRKSNVIAHLEMFFDVNDFFRVCAKIVFNFLAYKKGSEFVLDKKFDSIRKWIIYGGKNKFVSIQKSTIESKISYPIHSHRIIITKVGKELLGLLTLYDYFDLFICLCDEFEEDFGMICLICDWLNCREFTSVLDYIRYTNDIRFSRS